MSLSDFQLKIAKLIFAINEAEGFALAGGGALILHKVVDRTTNDLDCFGPSREAVDRFWPAIRDALIANGLAIEVSQAAHGFAKLVVSAPSTTESTQIDVGFDPAFLPPVLLSVGRVRALQDLAGDKMLALFGRAAPRDFVDVHGLRKSFSRRELESLAAAKDKGFSLEVLSDAFGVLTSRPRNSFEVDDVRFEMMCVEFAAWRDELLNLPSPPTDGE
jgi:hypothetical protein